MNGKVRIKDKMRSAYTPEQWLGVLVEAAKEERFEEHFALTNWEIREAIYSGPDNYRQLGGWKRYKIGDTWGGEDHTAFFRCEVKVPASFKGKTGVLRLIPGGEALLKVNGKPFAGLDEKHDTVFIADKMRGGETLKLEIEAYIRQMDDADLFHTFRVAELAILDRDCENAYFDLKCAYEGMESPRSMRDVRHFLFDELNKAVALIDFSAPDRATFKAGLMKAAARVRKNVYESGKYRDEGRLNMVGHSHIDLVYLWSYKEFLRKIGRTHSTALNIMREFPDYLFCQSQMKLYEDLKLLYPDIYKQIKKRVSENRWEVIGGMYIEPDCNLVSGESLVRQLLVGKRFMQSEFGRDSEVCWLPDVFGNSWIMPQILARAGIKYFITVKLVVWNDTNEFPHNTFRWEGPDGSRILCHMPATHFGAEVDADIMLTNWDEYKQKIDCSEAIYNYGHGDGRGGPMREDILAGRRFSRFPGMPDAEFTHGGDFFKRAEAVATDKLPIWKDELYLETHRGTYTTQAILKKNNRKSEIMYRNAEMMSSIGKLLGGAYPQKAINEGWKTLLKNQFHDILPGSHVTEACIDAVADYKTVFAAGGKALCGAREFIATKIKNDSDDPAVAVFNAQTWERDNAVEAEFKTNKKEFKIVDAAGAEVPYQVIERNGGKVRTLIGARGVPAAGYSVYRLAAGKPAAGAAAEASEKGMENEFFSLMFSKDGTISRIYDKRQQRDVLVPGGGGNRFQIFEDDPGRYPAWDIVPMYKNHEYKLPAVTKTEVVERGPVRVVVRQTRKFMKSKMVQRIIMYNDVPRIDFETEIDWAERNKLLKVGFPVEVSAMKAAYDISFGFIERPTHGNTTWDAAKFEVCGHQWADISEGDYGVSLLNDC
ncbi:MAG: glycoside hydrolase family 38 C-terminal domain-containing protein, partial [bacterium]